MIRKRRSTPGNQCVAYALIAAIGSGALVYLRLRGGLSGQLVVPLILGFVGGAGAGGITIGFRIHEAKSGTKVWRAIATGLTCGIPFLLVAVSRSFALVYFLAAGVGFALCWFVCCLLGKSPDG